MRLWFAVLASMLITISTGCMSGHHKQTIAPPLTTTVTIVSTNYVFFVGGEVKQPGRFSWTNGVTLTQAIQIAGGFTDFASRWQIQLQRENGSVELYRYATVARGLTNNPILLPNDQLYVGKNHFLPAGTWPLLRSLL